MIASILLLGTYLLLGIPVALVCIPWRLVTGDIVPLYRAAMWIVRTGLRMAGIRLQVEGLDRIPQGKACIFMANHISNLDPPLLIPVLPGRTSIFLKRSLMKIPVLGFGMQLASFVPVDRAGTVDGAQESVRRARQLLEQGIHFTTFVEGTRSRDGRLLPFKKGPFYLALESNAPCIPVSIWGTESMMKKGSLRIHPGTAQITFHKPIYPAQIADRDLLMAAVRNAIASALPGWMHES